MAGRQRTSSCWRAGDEPTRERVASSTAGSSNARSGTSLAADAVDTGELLADVAASLASAVERVHGRVETSPPTVRGDRAQLGRVFQNLVANGLKFHSDQPPR